MHLPVTPSSRLLFGLIAATWILAVRPDFSSRPVAAADYQFDVSLSERTATRLSHFIEQKQIAGAVTVIAGVDGFQERTIVGSASLEERRPMTADTIFRIASMTKTITAAAFMILVDEGRVAIDDPVEKYIPSFHGQTLMDGTPSRPVTIRQVMTHTAGLSNPRGDAVAGRDLAGIANAIGSAPLQFEPGSKWSYSSGLTVVGRIIEVVSGQPYEEFLKKRLFVPLEMVDTSFVLSPEQARRLAVTYEPASNEQGMAPTKHAFAGADATLPTTPNPSGGLFSTAGDLTRFYLMILKQGRHGDRQLLSADSIKHLRTIHTGDLVTGFTPGNGWGLGWCVVRQPQGVTRLLSPGTYGHGGAFGTQAWIDPHRGLVTLLLIQRTNFGNSDGSDVRDAFHETMVQSGRGPYHEHARFLKFHSYDQAVELSNNSVKVVLCPQAGGRVLEYSLQGKNSLYFSDEEKAWAPGTRVDMSAGRFDIGPEQVIPQRPTLWSGQWTAEITGPYSARLLSQHDPATGVQLMRDFELAPEGTRLRCTQTIMNVSNTPREWCHWSRTFATGHGICVMPLTSPSRFPSSYVMYEDGGLINVRPEDDHIRVRDGFLEIFDVPRKPKLGFDSHGGWMAYLTTDNLLFLKRFQTWPDRVYNEAAGLTMSVWYPEGPRVELEPIGPREKLAPGEVAAFTEEWHLAPFDFPNDRNVDLKRLAETVDKLR